MALPEDLKKIIATKHDIALLTERIVKLETIYDMISKIDAIWGRLEKLEIIVTIQGEQIRRLEERMDRLEERMDRLEERMDRLEEKMERLDKTLAGLAKNMKLMMLFMGMKLSENGENDQLNGPSSN